MPVGAGFETTKVARKEANGWRVELTPATDAARRALPWHPFVGYGDTEDAASWDAIQAFAAALAKLTDEQRDEIKQPPLDGDNVRLVGAATSDTFNITSDEAAARAWAAEEKARRAQ